MSTKHVRQILKVLSRVCMLVLIVHLASPAVPARADTSVCGAIASNTTWTSAGNNYIVTCDVTVNAGVTLTIQSGVVVRFDPGTSLQVNGTLIATGATFTSNSATPAKGDWGRIYFTSSSIDAQFDDGGNYINGSKIESSLIEWGGGWVNGALHIEGASPYIYSNTIRNNNSSGIHAAGRSASVPIVVYHNNINNNALFGDGGGGIFVNLGLVKDNNVSNNSVTNNWDFGKGGGIYALGSDVTGNTISGNIQGGLYASSSTIKDNLVSGNTSTNCSGIGAIGNSVITNNTIENNTASNLGGGICATGGLVTSNQVNGNSAPYQGGGVYADHATVSDNLINANNGGSGGGIYGVGANLNGNTLTDNFASSDGGGIYAYENTFVTSNTIQNNAASRGGGIYAEGVGSEKPTINGNDIHDNTATSGAGIYSLFASITGNTVSGNTSTGDGGGIYAEGGTQTGNILSANAIPSYGHGSGAYLSGEIDFTYNDVLDNAAPGGTAGGVTINGQPTFQYNNLEGNQPYDAEVVSPDAVTGTLNYWGASICTAIPSQIYDGKDAPGRGILSYAPSLYSPVPLAQLTEPTNLVANDEETSLTLSWTPSPAIPNIGCRVPGATGPDLGYVIYYSIGTPCGPFNGKGLLEGDSPIDVGTATSYELSGFSQGDYYMVVAAYDYLGRESAYSNAVLKPDSTLQIFLPQVKK